MRNPTYKKKFNTVNKLCGMLAEYKNKIIIQPYTIQQCRAEYLQVEYRMQSILHILNFCKVPWDYLSTCFVAKGFKIVSTYFSSCS